MRTAKTLIRLGGCPADLSLRWAHTHFVGFVTRRLIFTCHTDSQRCELFLCHLIENDIKVNGVCALIFRIITYNNFVLYLAVIFAKASIVAGLLRKRKGELVFFTIFLCGLKTGKSIICERLHAKRLIQLSVDNYACLF